jgi:hypothetical protein
MFEVQSLALATWDPPCGALHTSHYPSFFFLLLFFFSVASSFDLASFYTYISSIETPYYQDC